MKPNEPIKERLRRMWLFAELSDPELETLGSIALRRPFKRGTVIVQQGDTEDTHMYCVLRGHLKVTTSDPDGDQVTINVLPPGHYVGEISLLDGQPRSASVTGMDAGELLAIRRADFKRILNLGADGGIGAKLLVAMATRIRHLTKRVHDNSALPVPMRVAKRLDELADSIGTCITARRVMLNVKLSQQDLGDMIPASRESVNKCMRALQRAGIVELNGGHIVIVDRDLLRAQIAA